MMIYVGLRAVATCIAAGACLGVCGNLDLECEDLTRAEFIWIREDSDWSRIDSFVNDESSGFGWTVLGVLDSLNQISKTAFSLWAVVQAREYARKNGADLNPVYGLTLPGKSVATSILPGVSVTLPIPTLPLARGPEQATAFRLESHQYEFKGRLNVIVSLYVISIDPGRWIESLGLYQVLRWANINHLKGDWGKLGAILNSILNALPGELTSMLRDLTAKLGQFLGIELLSWKSDPPRPMLLTDNPQNDLTDQRDIDERTRDNLRPYLQYLGVALGRVPNGGRIGNALFFNRPNALFQAQLTYAQADVYNPTNWDMWTQDWRAQLTRAKLFDQKVNDYLSILHIAPDFDWSFVNTH